MARTTRVVFTCDLHGDDTEAVTTVLVTSGRTKVELDLCQAHVDDLVHAGRKAAGARRRSSDNRQGNGTRAAAGRRGKSSESGPSSAAVREWANARGYTISARGRIPADVLAAYSEAQTEESSAND